MNTLDKYLFQAIDAYPYDLEETVESLNYALSYDETNTKALCLMGQVYAEQLKDYETAKSYFQDAIAENIHAIDVYLPYINTLLWNEDLEDAEKLINFAFSIKGIDKAVMYLKKAHLFEIKQEYKRAIKHLKKAKKFTYNSEFISYLDDEKSRMKGKIPKKKNKKKKKQKPCSKSKKKKK